jgi:hypothetical protein
MTPVSCIERIDLALHPSVNFVAAESSARELAAEHQPGFQALVAWWDDERGLGGPADARIRNGYSAVAQYARDQSASLRIHVNRGQYEFFYKSSGDATSQPDLAQSARNAGPATLNDQTTTPTTKEAEEC